MSAADPVLDAAKALGERFWTELPGIDSGAKLGQFVTKYFVTDYERRFWQNIASAWEMGHNLWDTMDIAPDGDFTRIYFDRIAREQYGKLIDSAPDPRMKLGLRLAAGGSGLIR